MNTIITLTNGKKLDVKHILSYVVDAVIGKPAVVTLHLTNGKKMKVSIQDLECIETYRRELKDIKNEP